MEIIDSHCHIYPEKIAAKAVASTSKFYGIKMNFDGTRENLLNILEKNNISMAVVHSTATKPEQVPSINNFIIDTINYSKRFIGFGTLHPDYPDIEGEFNKIIKSGLRGIKIHPDFQMRNIDDEKMHIIYETVGDKVPILFHIGDISKDYSNPIRLRKILDKFPKLKVIAAHMGGYSVWQEAAEVFKGKDVWVDTCSSFYYLTDYMLKKLIDLYGTDRILFGTDYPMWDFKGEYDRLLSLNLKNSDLEKIFSKNIKELLKI